MREKIGPPLSYLVGAAEASLPGEKGDDEREGKETKNDERHRYLDHQVHVHAGLFQHCLRATAIYVANNKPGQ